jgi:hypothetical protein
MTEITGPEPAEGPVLSISKGQLDSVVRGRMPPIHLMTIQAGSLLNISDTIAACISGVGVHLKSCS